MTNKELLKELRKRIEKDFGKKCKDYTPICGTCEVHRALESLEYLLDG